MDTVTEFYRSQIGGSSVINYCYTDFPWRLFAKDVYYFFVYIWALPWILMPLWPHGSDHMDELYPNAKNLFCIALHFILCVLQLAFVIALPYSLVLPVWTALGGIAAFLFINYSVCLLLNGADVKFHSDKKYAEARPEHQHEQWVFVSGVAVGEHWMQNNLNRLALTFKRPVLGIHNKTSGIIFDVVECLVQRNFGYATSDVRTCFRLLKEVLYDPSKSKVILILHSQGGIVGGMVLDWLLLEMPQDLLSKLEVYTFGNAANHFNNPHRHVVSQSLSELKPLSAMGTVMTESSYETPGHSPQDTKGGNDGNFSRTPSLKKDESSLSSARSISAAKDRALGHVEHYAHSTDFVAIWGVLHFATNHMGSPQLPRFLGRLFTRSDGRGGHQFNQHYLDGMFPLKRDESGEFIGADEDNPFMNEVIKAGKEGAAMENVREAFEISYAGTRGFGSGDIDTPVEVHGIAGRKKLKEDVKVKDLSRLWSYRNGMSPTDVPPLLFEGGMIRNATM